MKPDMAEGRAGTLSSVELVECPKCAARLTFYRNPIPVIDSSGFESYSLKCDQCGAELVGIVDPLDNELLISELEH
jgi:hypothetical protein